MLGPLLVASLRIGLGRNGAPTKDHAALRRFLSSILLNCFSAQLIDMVEGLLVYDPILLFVPSLGDQSSLSRLEYYHTCD